MNILGIETSCDETAASIAEGNGDNVKILSNIVSSQIDIHKKYGGVVPEVAAREHILNILPVIDAALEEAGITRPNPPRPRLETEASSSAAAFRAIADESGTPPRRELNAIAVTIGPGLITSLIAGIETAKVLSYAWDVPIIGINHIEGHIYANFINNSAEHPSAPLRADAAQSTKIKFPTLILTVSGGHTMLVLMHEHGKYKTIGETRDDAAGEAFDKAAKMLGIGYPGGPAVARAAVTAQDTRHKETNKSQISNPKSQINPKNQIKNSPPEANQPRDEEQNISLPRPMINSNNFDFSFSGLKTALLYHIKNNPNSEFQIPNYCHEFQQAVIDVLIHKTVKAAK